MELHQQKWLNETPEEEVRQEYLCILVNEYSFALDRLAEEESVTGRGSDQARANFIIWCTAQPGGFLHHPRSCALCSTCSNTCNLTTTLVSSV